MAADENDQSADVKGDSLATYRAKRSSDRSPEPVGHVAETEGRLFVVHKHAASRLHWDLRIEMDGVLKSWAVPKGPSYDTNDKRLLYARAGIREYWVVDINARTLLVYRDPQAGDYASQQAFGPADAVAALAAPAATVRVADLLV